MTKHKALAASLAAATVLGLGGCRRADVAPTPASSYVHWWAGRSSVRRRPFDFSRRELAALNLPRVPSAGFDGGPPDRHAMRFVVNLLENDSLMFKGNQYPWEPVEGRDRVRKEIGDLVRQVRLPHRETSWVGVLIRADAHQSWSRVAAVVEIARGAGAPIDGIHLGADLGPSGEGRIEATPRPLGDRAGPLLALDTVADPSGAAPRARLGDKTWTFPSGEPYALAASVEAANANWDAIFGALQALAASRPALRLTIDPRVPWSHVAQLLGLVVLAGLSDVDLVNDGYGFRLSTPRPSAPQSLDAGSIPFRPREVGERDERDWPPALGISIGVAAAGLLVWLSSRRGKPRRLAKKSAPTPAP